ncbi:UNVERIFIED_CONTAM: hypothetical protein K2H54_022900 [Gekko kuhli]
MEFCSGLLPGLAFRSPGEGPVPERLAKSLDQRKPLAAAESGLPLSLLWGRTCELQGREHAVVLQRHLFTFPSVPNRTEAGNSAPISISHEAENVSAQLERQGTSPAQPQALLYSPPPPPPVVFPADCRQGSFALASLVWFSLLQGSPLPVLLMPTGSLSPLCKPLRPPCPLSLPSSSTPPPQSASSHFFRLTVKVPLLESQLNPILGLRCSSVSKPESQRCPKMFPWSCGRRD